LIKSREAKRVLGTIAAKMRLGQNHNLHLVEMGDRLVLIPPLSGSSTLNAYASRLGWKRWTVDCVSMPQTLMDRHVTFVMRPDFDRLLSFFNKKIRNPGTLSKYLFYLSFPNFFHDMTFDEFLREYSNMRSRRDYLDKHLLLNKELLSSAQVSIVSLSEFYNRLEVAQSVSRVNSSLDVAVLRLPYMPTEGDRETFEELLHEYTKADEFKAGLRTI
jgi:hypothetical protein